MDVDPSPVEEFCVNGDLMKTLNKRLSRVLKTVLLVPLLLLNAAILVSCASKFLQYENSEKVLENKEFDSAIRVKEIEVPPTPEPTATPEPGKEAPTATPTPTPTPVKKTRAKKGKGVETTETKPREPRFEDDEGFVGRRPAVDPFRPGEEVVLDISYFGVDAGELTIQTLPFVEVNGRKAYRFHSIAKTVSVFEMFYKVDDFAETLVDFETMTPFSYVLHVKESKQLRDARALHDLAKGRMFFWDKKITKENGVEEKKQDWELPAYSQNIFSALWYLRTFTLRPGKKIKFRMSHENENLMITIEVVRKETISTSQGKLETVVIRPSAEKEGEAKNIGQSLFWLTDDDRKLMVRMESKIKIGTIVGSLKTMKK